ncbi:preprotein translocase subunit SecA [Acinetobacter sp. B5B]|uniref:preprotein translocase subunit SecA n=1 Tax=Acinetobacter baretiae TaxID=2605383 RepID=UPI0018C23DBA|nr:preprotein translocase subunit SecA [Acinetobacter baretiae]MBF7683475.1 preprotein translocase subunit SecA [Acinetobacter baretiae]MBF7684781.1 preprotein translocase subunit SecA [Acinetobacter baretiae]
MSKLTRNKFHHINRESWIWKLYLSYDIFMMIIIFVNLFCLIGNAILMSHFAYWFFDLIHHTALINNYKQVLHPWVELTESWFICFLILELLIRWGIAILRHHYSKWFFFPFIHWYEVLAIFPQLRFLRLLRAGLIIYRLYQLGYRVIPHAWYQTIEFYYNVVMEEISDRVVINVLDGIKNELDHSHTHKKIIHSLVEHHKDLFAQTMAEMLQENLAVNLQEHHHRICKQMGEIVQTAITNTSEVHHLLRLFPIIGSKIEGQAQLIAKKLGENLTDSILSQLTQGSPKQPNIIYTEIATKMSNININNQSLEKLVESIVYESLESIQKQVKVKQWQQLLKATENKNTNI